jgi:AcrR family transcriptional regulator
MSISRAARSTETTARLIAVARKAFAAQGYGAVSLDALAAEAGVTRGALHHHFTNKAGLFEAVLRQIDTEMAAEIEARCGGEADHWTAFRNSFHCYLDIATSPDHARILFQDGPAVLGTKAFDILVDSGLSDTMDWLRMLIADGRVTAPDAEALAHLLNGATLNLAFWVAGAPSGEDRAAVAHATLSRLFDGFGPPAP